MDNNPNYSSNNSTTGRASAGFKLENPFSLKIAQVFTGFGVGCGVGIGIGKPIYLGAIPMLQPVLSATRGATDVFSGVALHVNSTLKKVGVRNIEAGIGCGVGLGHGFGVGIALKPGVVQQLLSSFSQAVAKLNINIGSFPGFSSVQTVIPDSAQSSSLNAMARRNVGISDVVESQTEGSIFSGSHEHSTDLSRKSYDSKLTLSERPIGTQSEKVIDNFLQNPLLKDDKETELGQVVGKLRSENSMLQLLIKHQQLIEELIDKNQKLQQILVEDLKVQPCKLEGITNSTSKYNLSCNDCFECRRRRRRRSVR